jgi:hypothetical protein
MSRFLFTKFKNSLQNWCRLTLSCLLISWTTRILCGWWCKSLWRIGRNLLSFKRSVRACRRADLRGIRKKASLTRCTLSGARPEHWRPCGFLFFIEHSWRHFDTNNGRVLRLGTSHLGNCFRKPRCVAVIDSVFVVWCCTDQRSN